MHTPDARLDASSAPSDREVPLPPDLFVRVDLALVDRLLAIVGRCARVSYDDVVLATVALAPSSYYAAEAFVTDLASWPADRARATTPVQPLVDALLDLRLVLTSTAA
jgi:hypothetical protein